MTMRYRKIVFLLVTTTLIISVADAKASDAYVVRFYALGAQQGCRQVFWNGDAILMNTTGDPAAVRLLGVSDGAVFAGVPTEFTLAAGEIVSLSRKGSNWAPFGSTSPTWIVHLDLPPGVVIEGRDEATDGFPCIAEQFGSFTSKTSLPVLRALAPAGLRQIKLGTDLAQQTSHQNVLIYNASAVSATANIEVRQACDNSIVDQRLVQVAPNSSIQVTGLSGGGHGCRQDATAAWVLYTAVTVSQPSLVFVSTVGTRMTPLPSNIAPLLELSVCCNN